MIPLITLFCWAGICLELPPPPIADMPAVVTRYDPSRGGVNCDDDCSTIASGPLTPDMYMTVAACPAELYGATVTVNGYSFDCLDRGGAIVIEWDMTLGWHVHIDVMAGAGDWPDLQWVAASEWGYTWHERG